MPEVSGGEAHGRCMEVDVGEADREVGPARCVGSIDHHDAL